MSFFISDSIASVSKMAGCSKATWPVPHLDRLPLLHYKIEVSPHDEGFMPLVESEVVVTPLVAAYWLEGKHLGLGDVLAEGPPHLDAGVLIADLLVVVHA